LKTRKRPPWWLAIVLGALLGATQGAGGPDPAPDELERNRRLLDKWRADPEHYQRLQRDLRAFWALPPQRQQSMRTLDRQLHQTAPATQARLWGVLERYVLWLEGLPEDDRQQVLQASGPAERLRIIKDVRQRQWIDRLPTGTRIDLLRIPDPKRRLARIAQLRALERMQRRQWQRPPQRRGLPPPRPRKLREFPTAVQRFVREKLQPRLTAREKDELKRAESKWPELARTILRLAAKYPVYPEPLPPGKAVKHFQDLPQKVKRALLGQGKRLVQVRAELKPYAGKWPDFALAVVERIRPARWKDLPALGPSRPAAFPPEARTFILAKMKKPLLSDSELKSLQRVEGRWPAYPRRLLELARRKGLVIPGMSLPGPRQLWQQARSALPDLPAHVLRDFALNELTAEERANLNLSASDPETSRERLKQEYYKRKPHERERLRGKDRGE
jgi:hypothetical protein